MIRTPIGDVPDRKALDRLRASLAQFNRRQSDVMSEIDRRDWPRPNPRLEHPPVRAWRSKRFMATLYVEPGKPAKRLSICRAMLNDLGQFEDGLAWEELQTIKNECGFQGYDAVEVYPRDGDVVNVSNMRHLWLLDDPSPLAWRS